MSDTLITLIYTPTLINTPPSPPSLPHSSLSPCHPPTLYSTTTGINMISMVDGTTRYPNFRECIWNPSWTMEKLLLFGETDRYMRVYKCMRV